MTFIWCRYEWHFGSIYMRYLYKSSIWEWFYGFSDQLFCENPYSQLDMGIMCVLRNHIQCLICKHSDNFFKYDIGPTWFQTYEFIFLWGHLPVRLSCSEVGFIASCLLPIRSCSRLVIFVSGHFLSSYIKLFGIILPYMSNWRGAQSRRLEEPGS